MTGWSIFWVIKATSHGLSGLNISVIIIILSYHEIGRILVVRPLMRLKCVPWLMLSSR